MKTLAERFHPKHEHGADDECWLWTAAKGGKDKRYGVINRGGRGTGMEYAHRVAWMLAYGTIPAGMEVDHRCKHTLCVNPAHLRIVTPLRNKQLERRETCGRGHRDRWGTNSRGHRTCLACRADWAREARAR